MSESLRNDGRVWVPKKQGDTRPADQIPEDERDYFLERIYPASATWSRATSPAAPPRKMCDAGYGVGPTGYAVYLDFADAIKRLGKTSSRSGTATCSRCTTRSPADDPYEGADAHLPRPHYTMGGLWVDYNLMSTIPGLHVLGEANFSDHGANRLGASALMQGLADGYFVIPYTLGHYLASSGVLGKKVSTDHAAFKAAEAGVAAQTKNFLSVAGKKTVREYHWQLGRIMWDHVGMGRSATGLEKAIGEIKALRAEFDQNAYVGGSGEELNKNLEFAGRVADYFELGELMARDALERKESCGGHFREEYQTPEGEALRDDENFCHVSAWKWEGADRPQTLVKEPLTFENVHLAQRSYK
jgi:succinate dehydrogenase / fumarate reductase flavoprotein subunit